MTSQRTQRTDDSQLFSPLLTPVKGRNDRCSLVIGVTAFIPPVVDSAGRKEGMCPR
jgi:hypothetical protein